MLYEFLQSHAYHCCVGEDVCLVSEGRDGGQYGFFVHPGESVTLPFKYQCFSYPSSCHDKDVMIENRDDIEKKAIKVSVSMCVAS